MWKDNLLKIHASFLFNSSCAKVMHFNILPVDKKELAL